MSEDTSHAIMALQIEQIQAVQNLSERVAKLEVEIYKIQAGQLRIMAFAGIVGTGLGFLSGHVTTIVKYVKGLFGP